jgi:hypothetical protein
MDVTYAHCACRSPQHAEVGTEYKPDNWPITWTLNPLVSRPLCLCSHQAKPTLTILSANRKPLSSVHSQLPLNAEVHGQLESHWHVVGHSGKSAQWRFVLPCVKMTTASLLHEQLPIRLQYSVTAVINAWHVCHAWNIITLMAHEYIWRKNKI